MKRLSPIVGQEVAGKDTPAKLARFESEADATDARIGSYWSKLTYRQKERFTRISKSIQRQLKVYPQRNPLETILVRQIALNTIRIELAESDLLEDKEDKYSSNMEKWLLLAQKERRDAITTLSSLIKAEGRKDKLTDFGGLRNILRKDEDLPPTKTEMQVDPKQRRYHKDGITRTAKPDEGPQENE